MSNFKTLHVSHTDINYDSRILKEMSALAKKGYEVYGIGINIKEGAALTEIDFKANIQAISLISRKFTLLPRTLRHIISLIEIILKMLPRAIRSKPKIIHCHDTLVLPLGVIIKWVTGAKLIYDAHELESNRNGLSRIQGWLTLLTEKILWRFIDALIVVSPSIQSWYVGEIGYKPSTVILNSPQYNDDNDLAEDYLRSKYCITRGELIFVYVGILGRGRGLDLIIDAFSSSKIKSHVVFLGYGELSGQLEILCKAKKNFHLHPAVPHSKVVPIIRSADFGLCLIQNVSLSDYYCLPNKLFEYCFANIPVLASKFPDIKALIDEHDAGECCDLNVADIINAVKRIENGTLNYKLKNLQNLSWQAQEIKLLDLYTSLCRF